tara:strand:+ start:815 stop:961 length:147 start_codon:yes stop_codon:yes gene_type:complete
MITAKKIERDLQHVKFLNFMKDLSFYEIEQLNKKVDKRHKQIKENLGL